MEMTVDGNTVLFRVRVQPRARRDAIEGERDGALKVRLTAPPVEGRRTILSATFSPTI